MTQRGLRVRAQASEVLVGGPVSGRGGIEGRGYIQQAHALQESGSSETAGNGDMFTPKSFFLGYHLRSATSRGIARELVRRCRGAPGIRKPSRPRHGRARCELGVVVFFFLSQDGWWSQPQLLAFASESSSATWARNNHLQQNDECVASQFPCSSLEIARACWAFKLRGWQSWQQNWGEPQEFARVLLGPLGHEAHSKDLRGWMRRNPINWKQSFQEMSWDWQDPREGLQLARSGALSEDLKGHRKGQGEWRCKQIDLVSQAA